MASFLTLSTLRQLPAMFAMQLKANPYRKTMMDDSCAAFANWMFELSANVKVYPVAGEHLIQERVPGYDLIDNADLRQWIAQLIEQVMSVNIKSYNISYCAAFTAWLYPTLKHSYSYYQNIFNPVNVSGWGKGIQEIIKGWGGDRPRKLSRPLPMQTQRAGRAATSSVQA